MSEAVNHPAHYQGAYGVEYMDAISNKRTCRMEYDPVHCDYVCTACGERYESDTYVAVNDEDGGWYMQMCYCPNCGARVMDE